MIYKKISVLEQCQFLEEGFGTAFNERFLNDPDNAYNILKEAKHTQRTKSTQALFRLMCRPVFGDRTCPDCLGEIDPLLSSWSIHALFMSRTTLRTAS